MNDTRGFSTIGMAMMLLLLGSLMLNGLQQQLGAQFVAAGSESQAIKAFAQAEAALEWATDQRWQPGDKWQCRMADDRQGRGCLLQISLGNVLLAGQSGGDEEALTLWRSATIDGDMLRISSQGWSDFCPLREVSRCVLP